MSSSPTLLGESSGEKRWNDDIVWVIIVLSVLVGLGELLFGHRLCRVFIFFNGLVSSVPVNILLHAYASKLTDHGCVYVAASIGVLGGVLAIIFWRQAGILYGVNLGFTLVGTILSLPIVMDEHHSILDETNIYPLFAGISVFFSGLFLFFPKAIMIASTSSGGALTLLIVLDQISPTGFCRRFFAVLSYVLRTKVLFAIDILPVTPGDDDHGKVYYMFGGWIMLSLIGGLIQFFVSRSFDPYRIEVSEIMRPSQRDERAPLILNTNIWGSERDYLQKAKGKKAVNTMAL